MTPQTQLSRNSREHAESDGKLEFRAEIWPSPELCRSVANLAPENPFYTPAYVEARRSLGLEPWVVGLFRRTEPVSACTAFLARGFMGRLSLEIPSLPDLPDAHLFWKSLFQTCRDTRLSSLEVNTYASRASIPALDGETRRRNRAEYVLDLQTPDSVRRLASNHKRNIKRAEKAGVSVSRAVDASACLEHVRLVGASKLRRATRGEALTGPVEGRPFHAYIDSGAGELFQATIDGRVVSSILVLTAEAGAYYQSAGTSPEGTACGASHLLVYETIATMRRRGMGRFNLGGADSTTPGLERFKAGFGADVVPLEAVTCFLGGRVARQLTNVLGIARNARAQVRAYVRR